MVTWQMTSRDPKSSRSWPQYLWSLISQKPCEMAGSLPNLHTMVFTWACIQPPGYAQGQGQGHRSRDTDTFVISRKRTTIVVKPGNCLWQLQLSSYYYYYYYYCIGLSRYIAITNLPIIAVFVEYLHQFLIDLNQTYRHSSVPKNTSPWIFWIFWAF